MPHTDLSQKYWQEFIVMFYKTDHIIAQKPVAIIMRQSTRERLAQTCFRGYEYRLAGNFYSFNSAFELFRNKNIVDGLVEDAKKAIEANAPVNSFSIDCEARIGWASTEILEKYPPEALERFNLNRKSTALRVKLDRKDLMAPWTQVVTVIYEIRPEDKIVALVIHSAYPGEDVGELLGDVTLREGRVFFDWNHPGDSL